MKSEKREGGGETGGMALGEYETNANVHKKLGKCIKFSGAVDSADSIGFSSSLHSALSPLPTTRATFKG